MQILNPDVSQQPFTDFNVIDLLLVDIISSEVQKQRRGLYAILQTLGWAFREGPSWMGKIRNDGEPAAARTTLLTTTSQKLR